jgi:RpiB/LacA/LacB family sugar-phosphate isomerase
MLVVVGSDHAGYDLKHIIIESLKQQGHQILDVGTDSTTAVDYPDFAEKVGRAVLQGQGERGVLICGSGIGASIAANKLRGVRAGLCHDNYSSHQGVEHDNMNVLVLGSRIIGVEVAKECVLAFLDARFTNEARHVRRLGKIDVLEQKFCDAAS